MKKDFLAKIITRRVFGIFSASIIILLSVVFYFFQTEVMHNSEVVGKFGLENGAIQIENFIKQHDDQMRNMKRTIISIVKTNKLLERHEMVKYMGGILVDYDDICGVWAVFEPNAYDNKDSRFVNAKYHDSTGRFLPNVTKAGVEVVYDYEKSDFYQLPKKNRTPVITNPYSYVSNGQNIEIITIAHPLILDGKFIGVVGCDIDIKVAAEMMKNIQMYGGKSTANLLDSEGNYITHSTDENLIGKNLKEDTNDPESRIKMLKEGKIENWFEGFVGCQTYPIQINKYMKPWQVQAKVHAKYVFANVIRSVIWISITLIIIISCFFILLKFRINKLIKPLQVLNDTSVKIAGGDLTHKIQIKTKDEIGELATSFLQMVDNLKGFIGEVQVGGEHIALASGQLNISSQNLSSNTNQQAGVAEEISSNMEEMTASVQQTSANAMEIRNDVLEVGKRMQELSKNANQVSSVQKEVSDKVKLINGIAAQIKILSLNAAVEAARAGEHGRGFAVVAREVQKLSEATANVSRDITQKSAISVERSSIASNVVKIMQEMINSLIENVDKIALSTDEQAQGITQVSNGTQQLNVSTQSNAAESEELASSGEELSNQAERLNEMVKRFKID